MSWETLFRSDDQAWRTPHWLFEQLHAVCAFDLDAAAHPDNALCEQYLTEEEDALSLDEWPGERIWLNPPYGRQVGKFVAKAKEQAEVYGKMVAGPCVGRQCNLPYPGSAQVPQGHRGEGRGASPVSSPGLQPTWSRGCVVLPIRPDQARGVERTAQEARSLPRIGGRRRVAVRKPASPFENKAGATNLFRHLSPTAPALRRACSKALDDLEITRASRALVFVYRHCPAYVVRPILTITAWLGAPVPPVPAVVVQAITTPS